LGFLQETKPEFLINKWRVYGTALSNFKCVYGDRWARLLVKYSGPFCARYQLCQKSLSTQMALSVSENGEVPRCRM